MILTPFLDDGDITLYAGDCIEVMRQLPADSIDAIITDPPYGLEFMGKGWDAFAPIDFESFSESWAREAFRVLKPGAHLLAFGGTRTYHRLAAGIEDAGFEIRDCLAWLYGSGFPKSLDVSKAIDKQRHDRAEIYEVTAWIRQARDAAGLTNKDIDAVFGANGMGRHWTDVPPHGKQPAVPTLEQVPTLLKTLSVEDADVPENIRRLLFELNGLNGQPGGAWFKRAVVGTRKMPERPGFSGARYGTPRSKDHADTTAYTSEAAKWDGLGTALKPAFEPIVLARKPLTGTVAQNVLAHGTGALNINATRISATNRPHIVSQSDNSQHAYGNGLNGSVANGTTSVGRWPANVALDNTAAALLDEQSGELAAGAHTPKQGLGSATVYGEATRSGVNQERTQLDAGGASRFFYTAKASRRDRNTSGANNTHPTVKPTDLMRWLIRLVTPPGGIILDPFGGSGTTGVAARAENTRCILIEREDEYLDIIRQRLAQLSLFSVPDENAA